MGWTTKLSGVINIYTLSLPGTNKLLHANVSLPEYKTVKYVTKQIDSKHHEHGLYEHYRQIYVKLHIS